MITLQLFGNAEACEMARELILEAVENKEQKAKQREKMYEKKRSAKASERQIYHLRHARDYEALELPLGASKADVKVAFRKLALKWHPDKNMSKLKERITLEGSFFPFYIIRLGWFSLWRLSMPLF